MTLPPRFSTAYGDLRHHPKTMQRADQYNSTKNNRAANLYDAEGNAYSLCETSDYACARSNGEGHAQEHRYHPKPADKGHSGGLPDCSG